MGSKFIRFLCVCMCSLAQLYPTLCDPMDCSPLGSSVHGISQARRLEWVAISYSRGSSWPGSLTHISCVSGLLHSKADSLPLCSLGSLLKDCSSLWWEVETSKTEKALLFVFRGTRERADEKAGWQYARLQNQLKKVEPGCGRCLGWLWEMASKACLSKAQNYLGCS